MARSTRAKTVKGNTAEMGPSKRSRSTTRTRRKPASRLEQGKSRGEHTPESGSETERARTPEPKPRQKLPKPKASLKGKTETALRKKDNNVEEVQSIAPKPTIAPDNDVEMADSGTSAGRRLVVNSAVTSGRNHRVPPPINLPVRVGVFANLTTWATTTVITLDNDNVRTLYQEKGRLSTSTVDAACYLSLNEWIEGEIAREHLDIGKFVLVPSTAWNGHTNASKRSPFLHNPQPLRARHIAIVVKVTDNHWLLAIVHEPWLATKGELVGSPTVIILDSRCNDPKALKKSSVFQNLATQLKFFLIALGHDSIPQEEMKKTFSLKLRVAKNTPSQTNDYDCGLWPAFFLRCFLANHEAMVELYTGEDEEAIAVPDDLWCPHYHVALRRRLQAQISMLHQQAYRPTPP